MDFNDIEDHDYVEADLDDAESFREDELREGARVELFDGGGHECQGEIVAVDLAERLVRVRIDWATWRSPAQLSEPITMVWDASAIRVLEGSFQRGDFADPRPVIREQPSVTVRR
ncbi:MAG TPA: RNA methyltransferase PUA domain-containing protein [Actinomycetes bacterium]|nr:RNA methyltransferase PUA domain-containing protein [Actinomycetes bacterium]